MKISVSRPYKVQLQPADHQQGRVIADWDIEMHENDSDLHRKIIFIDEAHIQQCQQTKYSHRKTQE